MNRFKHVLLAVGARQRTSVLLLAVAAQLRPLPLEHPDHRAPREAPQVAASAAMLQTVSCRSGPSRAHDARVASSACRTRPVRGDIREGSFRSAEMPTCRRGDV